jgi:hypothetical protein
VPAVPSKIPEITPVDEKKISDVMTAPVGHPSGASARPSGRIPATNWQVSVPSSVASNGAGRSSKDAVPPFGSAAKTAATQEPAPKR